MNEVAVPVAKDDKPPPASPQHPPAPAPRTFKPGALLYTKDEQEKTIAVTYVGLDREVNGQRIHRVNKAGGRGTRVVPEDKLWDTWRP